MKKDCLPSIFGKQLLLDCYDCDAPLVNDIQVAYRFLDKAVETLGVHKQSQPHVFQSPELGPDGQDWSDKRGLSGWVPLIESHVAIHTLVEKNFISIDYYTCSNITAEITIKLIDLAKRTFGSKRVVSQFIERGVDYYK
jgi:S-adenosylmethionine decarboxylase